MTFEVVLDLTVNSYGLFKASTRLNKNNKLFWYYEIKEIISKICSEKIKISLIFHIFLLPLWGKFFEIRAKCYSFS